LVSNDTKTDDLERYMWVYSVRELHWTLLRILYPFVADTIWL